MFDYVNILIKKWTIFSEYFNVFVFVFTILL